MSGTGGIETKEREKDKDKEKDKEKEKEKQKSVVSHPVATTKPNTHITVATGKPNDKEKEKEKELPNKLFYQGNWKSNTKDYEGTVQVVHDRQKRKANVYFVVHRGAVIPSMLLPYKKKLKMAEPKASKSSVSTKSETEQFPKLTGSVLGHSVSFSLDSSCTMHSEKLNGNFKTRGSVLDDDGRFTVVRTVGMDKSFKETAGCNIM